MAAPPSTNVPLDGPQTGQEGASGLGTAPAADLGRLDEALSSYDRALSERPDFAFALMKKAEVLERAGRGAEARSALERAAEIARRDGDVTLGRQIDERRRALGP